HTAILLGERVFARPFGGGCRRRYEGGESHYQAQQGNEGSKSCFQAALNHGISCNEENVLFDNAGHSFSLCRQNQSVTLAASAASAFTVSSPVLNKPGIPDFASGAFPETAGSTRRTARDARTV